MFCVPSLSELPILDSVFLTFINMTGMTSRAGTAYPAGAPELIRNVLWGTCCSIFSFLYSILQIIVGLFVLLCFAVSGYPFGYLSSNIS